MDQRDLIDEEEIAFSFPRTMTGSQYDSREEAFPRTMTGQLLRTITLTGIVDEEWGKEAIEEIEMIAHKGNDGDTPEQPAFANNKIFWTMSVNAAIMGILLGFAGLIFINIIDKTPEVWSDFESSDGYDFNDPENISYHDGNFYWVYVTTLAGFLVGSLRVLMKYPDNLPGFFKEVTECHVDPTWAPHTVLLSAISLGCGANLGPEQAMGNLGGGLAQIISNKMELDIDDKHLCVLSGMSAAMGCLFPTPVTGVLMIHELGNPPKSFMESTLLLSIPAICSFLVFYAIEDYTWIDKIDANYQLSSKWNFEMWHCGAAVLIGMSSAVIAMTSLVGVGVVKQVLMRIKQRADNIKVLNGTIVVGTLGGFLIGLVNYTLPLTFGNGHMISKALVVQSKTISSVLLRNSLWGRAFTMAVSMNCGFVGGFVFPMISIGQMAGVLCHQQYSEVPLGMAISCFIAAVPGALCPMPFTLLGISCTVFFLGLQQTVPVFISCIVSYLMLTGMGVLGAMQDRAKGKNRRQGDDSLLDDADKEDKALLGSNYDLEESVGDSKSMYGAKKNQRFNSAH